MSDITRVIDGDTFTTGDDTLRVSNIDTPESVHPDEKRNTPEGEVASQFAKDVMPVGSEVQVTDYGTDHFGREVSGVSRVINDVEIDYGLVALDQQMATYYTKYGEHPDPLKHNQYKEYYSRLVPYQIGSTEEPLKHDEVVSMTAKHEAFTKTYADFKEGNATQEQLDSVTADLYGDPNKVMRYRRMLFTQNQQMNQDNHYTLSGAMKIAMENSPEFKEQYNRAVKNGHLQFHPDPESEPSFWEKASASFSMLGSVSNLTDIEMMYDARRLGSDTEIPEQELLKGVPDQYHSVVLQEASRYNDHAALTLRNQLLEDIANNKVFDNMEWYAQLGYGALAVVADPLTLLPAAPVAKGGQAIVATNRAWQTARVVGGKSIVPGSATGSKLAAWAAGGAVEGAVFNAPRLAGDHTYTAKDYQLDILMDAGFGLGIGTLVHGGKGVWDYSKKLRESRDITQSQLLNKVESIGQPVEAATPELQEVKVQVDAAKAPEKARQLVAQKVRLPYQEWSAISEVSKDGFNLASRTLRDVFPKDTPMRKLINSQIGLNKKNLTPEERVVADKLNSDILHIASAFPDGKVPKGVGKAIEAVTFKQRTFKRNNALGDVLQGLTTDPTKTLRGYVNMLRNHTEIWEGYDPVPMSRGEFFAHQSDWLSMEGVASADDVFNLTQQLPKEISYLKDIVELNKMAAKENNAEFTALVEELNGMAATRMEQREFGEVPRYSDNTQSFGKSVPMTPPEIAAQLKKEGLVPRTNEYSARMKELRTFGRQAVSDEINRMGNLTEFKVGERDLDTTYDADKAQDFGERRTQTLVGDKFEQDLLPRSYTEIESQAAYKDISAEKLETLRQRLREDVGKKLGVFTIRGKKDFDSTVARLDKVKKALKSNRQATLDRMVAAGKWQNVEDVIRASHMLAQEAKMIAKQPKPDAPVEAEPVVQITEEALDVLDPIENVPTGKTPEETEAIKKQVSDAYDKLVEKSGKKIADGIGAFVRTGEKKAFEEARKPRGNLDRIGRMAAKITEDIGTKLQNSKLTSLEYFGSRVTEIGRGYGGAIRRQATGGIIRDAIYKESAMQILPDYARLIDSYAASKGKGAVGRMNAQQMAGADSKIVKQFNRDVFLVQEYRRSGRADQINVHQSVLDFVKQWDKYMDYNHDQLVTNAVGGFTAKRKVKHYIPHIWSNGRLQGAISKHGEDKVLELLRRAYASAQELGTNPVEGSSLDLAKRQIEWIKQQDENSVLDQYMPVSDSRAKQRLELDTTMEFEGLSVLDLLDDEVAGLATKYSNRMAGWVGLAKSTDGMLTSELDIDVFKRNMVQEAKDKGIDSTKYAQYYDDVINLMFGRPTRGGLTQELRQLKDLTALTRMGGLGTAQLIETGQVITRSVLNSFGDPKVAKRVIQSGVTPDKSELGLIREIQAISSLKDDLEWLERQSVHLDQHELSKVNKARQVSLWLADKATFGSLKAPASRLLGKTTGYNAVRRAQSRATQASFTIDIAKHFRDGTGVMGNARMADLGLTDINGKDVDLEAAFKKHVEYDEHGLPVKLNVDKWSKAAREKYQFALIRDEAQQIQRTHVGELPPWMNKPMMSLIFQFRQMPIVATNKQLSRAMAFADKEAVAATMLNAAVAGLVRYGKFALLGVGYKALTDNDQQEPNYQQMQTDKYIAQFGIFPEAADFVMGAYQAGTTGDYKQLEGQIPVLGLMKDYYTAATGDKAEQIEAAQGLVPLGNTAYGDMIHTWIKDTYGE